MNKLNYGIEFFVCIAIFLLLFTAGVLAYIWFCAIIICFTVYERITTWLKN